VEIVVADERAADLDDFGHGGLIVSVLLARDANAGHEIYSGRFANRSNHFGEKTHPICEVAAILVRAPINNRIEELGGQVAVARDDLAAIEARPAQTRGGLAIPIDDLADHPPAQGAGHDVEALVGNGRRRIGDGSRAILALHDLASRMKELAE
jgi:hypothetical protein